MPSFKTMLNETMKQITRIDSDESSIKDKEVVSINVSSVVSDEEEQEMEM